MPLIETGGTRVDRIGPERVKNSSAPERSCDSESVSEPSWLLGNTWISSRPPELALMRSAASFRRTESGCVAGTSLPIL